jgi:hypothetical protein
MIESQAAVDEIYQSLEDDLKSLFKLVFTYRTPLTQSDVRLASVILRKWLTGGLLGNLCHAIGATPTFFTLDNTVSLSRIDNHPSIDFFLTGGVKFNGEPFQGTYHSSLPYNGTPLLPHQPMPEIQLNLGKFLRQKRIFFQGAFFTCEDIILFVANKLGGAHLDYDREGRFGELEKAASFMKFGGPEPEAISLLNCTIYLPLERKGAEVLSGLHVEIVAAATSFIQLRLNDTPIFVLRTKPSIRTKLRKAIGLKRPRYIVVSDKPGTEV